MEPTTQATTNGGNLVLVVEDVELNRQIALAMLEVLGHRALVAEDAEAGLALLARQPVDLVLMDWRMPGMDGLQATRLLRQREAAAPSSRRTPVVIVSASVLAHDVDACFAAGADAHLPKPFRLADLRRIVDAWALPA